MTIPGVDRKAAAVIIAEPGADMSRFPSAGHLASWAGICPGSHESGGIRKSGKTREGNKPLGGALGTAALSAARTKNSYLSARYRRIVAHRGKQRATVAVEHSILTAVWHMLTNNLDGTVALSDQRILTPELFLSGRGKRVRERLGTGR